VRNGDTSKGEEKCKRARSDAPSRSGIFAWRAGHPSTNELPVLCDMGRKWRERRWDRLWAAVAEIVVTGRCCDLGVESGRDSSWRCVVKPWQVASASGMRVQALLAMVERCGGVVQLLIVWSQLELARCGFNLLTLTARILLCEWKDTT
jgi:hypothetical protein